MRISPSAGARKPAMMLSSVVLPQPLGPTMQRNSEGAVAKLTPRTPGTRPLGVSYTSVTLRISMWCIALRLGRAHHAPAHDGGALERAERQALEREADRADHRERGEHDVGVEELFRVEDHPAQAEIGCGEHLGADHRDPGALEGEAQPGDDERRGGGHDHLPEKLRAARAH